MVVSKIYSSGSSSFVSDAERSDTRFKMSFSRDDRSIRQIQEWTVAQVIQLLKQKSLPECIEAITKHEIDGETLLILTEGRLALWKRDIKTESSRKLMDLINDMNANPDRYVSSAKTPIFQPKQAAKNPIFQPKPTAKNPIFQPKPASRMPINQPKSALKMSMNQLKSTAKAPTIQPKPAAIALSKGPRLSIAVFQEKKEETNKDDFLNRPVQKLKIDFSKLNPDKLAKALNERSKLKSQIGQVNRKVINSKPTPATPTTTTLNKRPLPSLPVPEQDREQVYSNQEPQSPENDEEEILYLNNEQENEMMNGSNLNEEVEVEEEEEEEIPYYLNQSPYAGAPPLPPKIEIDQGPSKSKSLESVNSWDSFDDEPENEEREPLQIPARLVKNPTLYQKEEPIHSPMNFRPLNKPPPPPPKMHKNENEIEEDIYELPHDDEDKNYTVVNSSREVDYYLKPIGQTPPLPAKPFLMSVMEARRCSDSSSTSGSSGDGAIGNRTLGWVNKVFKGSNSSLNSNERTHHDGEKSPEPRKLSAVGLKGSNTSIGSSSNSSGTFKTQRPLPPPPTLEESPRKLPNGAVAPTPPFISWQGQPWYFNSSDRKRAKELVIAKGEEGCFLFRPSTRTANPLTLMLLSNGRVYNIPVRKRPNDNLYALGSEKDNEMTFSSIEEIVNYYKKEQLILYSGGELTGRVFLRSSPSLR